MRDFVRPDEGPLTGQPHQRRADLSGRIMFATARVRELGEGSERATASAISWCKQIIDDANELRGLLEERAEAIKGMDSLPVGRQ